MSEPEKKPAAPPPPPPAPPSLGELFESSAVALVNAPGVFARLAERPSPGGGPALALGMAWGVAFFALNLVHVSIAAPDALKAFEAWKIAAVAVLGLVSWTSLFLLASAVLYGLGRAIGTEGDFSRALLVAAIALTAAPVQALSNWLPAAWMIPTLLAGWIAACGLERLFKASPGAARGVCVLFAAGAIAVQYGAREFFAKAAEARQLAASMAQTGGAAMQLNADVAAMQEQMRRMQEETAGVAAAAGEPGRSSLDLLRGPGGETAGGSAPDQAQVIEKTMAQGDAMNKSVLGMLDSLGPILDNPAITRNMNPQQKADLAELQELMRSLKADIASNTPTSPQEQQRRMAKIQQLTMRMMSALATPPQLGSSPPAGKKP